MSSLSPTSEIEALVRPAVRVAHAYVPAKLPTEPQQRQIKLDMNESPYGPSPKTRAALAAFEATNRYPTFEQHALRSALADYLGVAVERVNAGAGLDDVLNNLMVLLLDPGDEVIISEPTFGVYRHLIGLRGGVTVDVPLGPAPDFVLDADGILAAITPKTKLVLVCDPNNPTGHQFPRDVVVKIVERASCLVAIDEAYAEFAGTSYVDLIDRYPNLIVLRTMSKFAGLAGMRVGYGVFPEVLMPHLWQVTPAFCNVSLASADAAMASLQDLEYLQTIIERIISDRDQLSDQLRELPGVVPYPSKTNFILAKLPVPQAGPMVAALAERGVHVRQFPNPEHGLVECLRVSIGTPEEHEIFLAELEAVLQEQRAG